MTVRITIGGKVVERKFKGDRGSISWIEQVAKGWARQPYFQKRKRLAKLKEAMTRRISMTKLTQHVFEIGILNAELREMTDPGKMSVEIFTENP